MADRGVNYLDIIKKGGSRDTSKDPVQRQHVDPLSRYNTGQNANSRPQPNDPLALAGFARPTQSGSQSRDPLSRFNTGQNTNTRPQQTDPLAGFARPVQPTGQPVDPLGRYMEQIRASPKRPSRPPSPIRDDPGTRSPLRDAPVLQARVSPSRMDEILRAELTSRSSTVYPPPAHDGHYRAPVARESPGRAVDEQADRPAGVNRQTSTSANLHRSENVMLTAANPVRSSEYESVNRNRQSQELKRPSTGQDPNLMVNVDRFNEFYREQDRNKKLTRNSMDIFQRKSREQLQRELGEIKAKKNVSILVFLATVAAVILLFGLFVSRITNQKPFCNSGSSVTPECSPCPEYGTCRDGRIVECQYGYKINGDLCVKQEKNERLVYIMYNEAIDLLARRRGEYLSGNTKVRQLLEINEIEQYLGQRFDSEQDYLISFFEVRRRLSSITNPDISVEYDDSKVFIRSTIEKYSWSGLCKIFWRDNQYLLYCAMAIFLVSCWFIVSMNSELNYRQKAAKYYRVIESYLLSAQHNYMLEGDLKRLLCKEFSASISEIDDVWPYVRYEAGSRQRMDFIRKNDAGIDQVGWWIDKNNSYQ